MRYCFALTFILCPLFLFAQFTPSDVLVIDEYTAIPEDVTYLGKAIPITGPRKYGCSLEGEIQRAKEEVFRLKGNILKIEKIEPPFMVTCYKIRGKAYYTSNLKELRQQIENIPDTITQQLIADTARYALLYFYRPYGSMLTPFKKKLMVDDVEACHGEKSNKCIRMIETEGEIYIHSEEPPVGQLKLNVKFGHVYFIRCEVTDDLKMTIQKPNRGYREFMKLK